VATFEERQIERIKKRFDFAKVARARAAERKRSGSGKELSLVTANLRGAVHALLKAAADDPDGVVREADSLLCYKANGVLRLRYFIEGADGGPPELFSARLQDACGACGCAGCACAGAPGVGHGGPARG
jgi:hypothetical protein